MHPSISKYSPDGRTVELRLGASLLLGSQMKWVFILALVIPLAILLIVAFMVTSKIGGTTDIAEALAAMLSSMQKDAGMDWQLWMLVFLVSVGVLFFFIQRFAYLKLTGYGIEGYVPKWLGLGITGLSTGHIHIPWNSIRSVRLLQGKKTGKPAMDLRGYRLLIELDRDQVRLSPFSWTLRRGPDHRLTLRESFPSKKFQADAIIERAPLIQVLRSRGIELLTDGITPQQESLGYDLSRHPGLVVQLVLFFVVGLYALIDAFFIGSFLALAPLPKDPFVMTGLLGVVLAFVLGKGAPIVERWIIGTMMVAVLTAAVHPGLLRLNAMTAEPEEIRYRAVGAGQFVSTTAKLPDLDLRSLDIDKYWSQYPEGSEHEFMLLRGIAGFYQVDLADLYERTRNFYSNKNKK